MNFFLLYQWNISEDIDKKDVITPSILGEINEISCDQEISGTYYTPKDIALFLTAKALQEYLLSVLPQTGPVTIYLI